MRKLLYTLFLAAIIFITSAWICGMPGKKRKPKILVTGSIMQTLSYCGGANPPQRILDSLNTPRGIPFAKLFVRHGSTNIGGAHIIDTIHADSSGNFSIRLPTGNYCLVEEWKSKPFILKKSNATQTVDSTCYKNLYSTCDFDLSIRNKEIRNVKIIFHRNCYHNQPCISFHGQLPPKAAPSLKP